MTFFRYLSVCGLVLMPGVAAAEQEVHRAYFDVIYVPTAESEVSNPVFLSRADGDGLAVRGWYQPFPRLFVQGEVQGNTYAADTYDISGMAGRIGVGTPLYAGKRYQIYGLAEAVSFDFIDRVSDLEIIQESGAGLHVGFTAAPHDAVTVHGRFGTLKLEDSDGREFQVGLVAKLDDRISGLVEYRRNEVDSIAGLGTPERVNYLFSEVRVGVRFSFDFRTPPVPAS